MLTSLDSKIKLPSFRHESFSLEEIKRNFSSADSNGQAIAQNLKSFPISRVQISTIHEVTRLLNDHIENIEMERAPIQRIWIPSYQTIIETLKGWVDGVNGGKGLKEQICVLEQKVKDIDRAINPRPTSPQRAISPPLEAPVPLTSTLAKKIQESKSGTAPKREGSKIEETKEKTDLAAKGLKTAEDCIKLAQSFSKQQQYDKAIEQFEAAVNLSSDKKLTAKIFAALGEAYQKRGDQFLGKVAAPYYKKAEQILIKSLELDPFLMPSYVYLANVYHELGKWEDKLNTALKAYAQKNTATTSFNVAEAYLSLWKNKNPEKNNYAAIEAHKWIKKTSTLDPNFQKIEDLKKVYPDFFRLSLI